MKDVVGEQRPVAIVLIIAVVDAAQIVEPVEQVEGRKDVGARRAARAGDRRRAGAGDGAERAWRRIEELKPAARDDAAACETAIIIAQAQIRSEEGRVGNEWLSTFRTRGLAMH